MQATEAIERLRASATAMLDSPAPTPMMRAADFDRAWEGHQTAKAALRNALAATATIDPAPVGAREEQQAVFCPECHAREGFPDGEELVRFLANEYLSGTAATSSHGAKVTLRYKTMVAAEAALDAIADAVDGLVAAQSINAGAAKGGNTNPEIPATQPAADHACPRDTPYGPAVFGECAGGGYQVYSSEEGKWHDVSMGQWKRANRTLRRLVPVQTGTLDHANKRAEGTHDAFMAWAMQFPGQPTQGDAFAAGAAWQARGQQAGGSAKGDGE